MGNKNSGRKTKKEEFKQAIEEIKQDELIKLANTKVYKQLQEIQNFKDVKEMALPITLKGIVEEKKLSGSVELKQITGIRIISDGIIVQDKNTETN